MGNAGSDAAEAAAMTRVETLRDQLAGMERAVRSLSRRPQIEELQPHEIRVFGHVLACNDDVRVLLGPVVGTVDATTARVLLETDRSAIVTCHVLIYDLRTDAWTEVPQCSVAHHATPARRPTVFRLASLLPGRRYRAVFSSIHREDAATKVASFRTPTLADGGALQCAVVSGDDVYELEYGEPSLWRDLRRAVVDDQRVQFVVHLGGQVAMKRMFDKAWALIVRHAECVMPPVTVCVGGENPEASSAFTAAWASLEEQAMEILRSAYRTQWTMMSDKASVLANASNLMLWSDWDVYPAFTTSDVFFIDHAQPTLEMQVLRTVVRCARRAYHEYQRALWDDDLDQVFAREAELRRVAEEALATTARIYQLSRQIPTAQGDLELQKHRRDIEGARKAERHVRALETEKTKYEKALVSFNQLLAPQAGEEFFYRIGVVGLLFVDMRSARIEAGGSQRAENEVISNVQWASIETVLEDESLQLLLVCSESPLVDDLPHELRAGGEHECDFKTWWGFNASAQQRLLGLLFEWKLQREGRDVVLLSGACNTRFSTQSSVRDTRLRTELTQWMAGPLTARASGHAIPSRSGTLFDRYAFEHSEVEALEKSLLYIDVIPPATAAEPAKKKIHGVNVTRVDGATVQDPARVVVGPVVGHVDAICAMVLLEVDRTCDLVAVVVDVLTGECHRVFQHFVAYHPNAFFLNHLRAEHFYEVHFERIQNANQHRCSFSTVSRMPSQLQLLVVGSMNSHGSEDTTTDALAEPLATRSVWPWINENVSTDVPFRGVDKMIHFEEAAIAPLRHIVKDDKDKVDDEKTRERIMASVREAQRLHWNKPGVRELLARGSHLILTDDTPRTIPEDADLIGQDCVTQVRLEYENLLLPPSKRVVHLDKRLENPIRFVFGAYGLFVLPGALTTTTASCDELWNCLDAFLKTPLLSFVAIVSSRPVIEDSIEDVEEKASIDSSYRQTLAFQQEKLRRLLDMLFVWQQQLPPGRTCDRQCLFVCGHHCRSFDSILHDLTAQSDVPRPLRLRQFVVGPFQQLCSGKDSSLQTKVFPQGTLFDKYGYYHRFQRSSDDEQQPSLDQDEKKPDPLLQSHQQSHTVLLHLQAEQKPTVDDHTGVDFVPTLIASNRITVIPPPSATAFTSSEDLRIQVVGPSNNDAPRWTLEPRHPVWLTTLLSQPLSEKEEVMMSEIKSVLSAKAADIEVSFQRADPLARGLVAADDRASFVTHLCAAFEDFHKHVAGMAFRSQYPTVPSAYVIQFTLQEMATANDRLAAISGAIDLDQYSAILIHCFQNTVLFEARLNSLWS